MDAEYSYLFAQLHKPEHLRKCYLTNNNFAYKYDTNSDYEDEIKIENFVPTYDKWCLNCGAKDAKGRCSKCKSVYFCNADCQKKCWPVHKKHCGRNLFILCINCGKENPSLKCADCPVRFCSQSCMDKILAPHKEYDCKYFAKTFG